MKIELTPAEQRLDLDKALRDIEKVGSFPDMPASTMLALSMARMVTRVALWLRHTLAEALGSQREAWAAAEDIRKSSIRELNEVKAERDKYLAEIENGPFAGGAPFDDALNELAYHHRDQLDARPLVNEGGEPAKDDPFREQEKSAKHGMGLDAFPLVEVERTLASNGMGSYQSWRKIAHAAVLAMSYLRPLYEENGQEIEDIENECDPQPAKAS